LVFFQSHKIDIPRASGAKVSRAAFLKACGTLLLGAGVDARALLTTAEPLTSAELALAVNTPQWHSADAERFRQQLNTSFDIRSADGTRARLMLAKVVERPITRNVAQFSLIFHAPPATTAPQGIYSVQHQALGNFDLFTVPIGMPNGRRALYQACFSRHLSKEEVGRAQSTPASPSQRT